MGTYTSTPKYSTVITANVGLVVFAHFGNDLKQRNNLNDCHESSFGKTRLQNNANFVRNFQAKCKNEENTQC